MTANEVAQEILSINQVILIWEQFANDRSWRAPCKGGAFPVGVTSTRLSTLHQCSNHILINHDKNMISWKPMYAKTRFITIRRLILILNGNGMHSN